jgi:2'-5' RNA ligase
VATAADSRRIFFALWPDAEVARALHAVGSEAHALCGGRLTRRETAHLTLAFIGAVPSARVADAAAAAAAVAAAAFEWQVDRLGYWQHNRILWAGGESAPLAALTADLAGRLRDAGFRIERRPFAAHVTLLRNARCRELPPLAAPLAWRVREFVLVESVPMPEGSRYDVIDRWPLVKTTD